MGLIFLISPFCSFAHNPLSAKFELIAGEDASLLNINLSQGGLSKTLNDTYGKEEIEKLSSKEYKELIIKYIKDNFILKIEGQTLGIEAGGIKFGSHQTDLKFLMPSISKTANEMEIEIRAFSENENHQNIFYYTFYQKKGHLILSESNSFKADLDIIESKITFSWWVWILLSSGLICIGIYFLRKKTRMSIE